MEKLEEKIHEIVDSTVTEKRKKCETKEIIELADKYELKLSNDYIHYLQFNGNSYMKDNYRYSPSYDISEVTRQDTFRVSCLFGLGSETEGLEEEVQSYLGILPNNLFPIGDLLGGNLVCMDKETGKIYLWYHDEPEGNDNFLSDDSFKQFIMNINCHEDNSSSTEIKLNFGSELDEALRKAAEKYKNK